MAGGRDGRAGARLAVALLGTPLVPAGRAILSVGGDGGSSPPPPPPSSSVAPLLPSCCSAATACKDAATWRGTSGRLLSPVVKSCCCSSKASAARIVTTSRSASGEGPAPDRATRVGMPSAGWRRTKLRVAGSALFGYNQLFMVKGEHFSSPCPDSQVTSFALCCTTPGRRRPWRQVGALVEAAPAGILEALLAR